ncbi:calmodulin-binding transcription activator 5-like [Forsythia ovata]|uniref:Calmodulin-binding transcription activator 5-like n=1 Tax=Forsythia ovata TaxID=205694 RepID=A0ABD1TSC3_9LAMI
MELERNLWKWSVFKSGRRLYLSGEGVSKFWQEGVAGSLATLVNSNSGSAVSDPSAHWPFSEESNSTVDRAYYSRLQLENNDSTTIKNHEQRLYEINTLEWDELVVPVDTNKPLTPQEARYQSFTHPINDNHGSSVLGQIFNITDVSPSWGLSNEETKILVVGFSMKDNYPLCESNALIVCGDSMVPALAVQSGVFRCSISPQSPGSVNLYLSFHGHTHIS